MMLKFMNLITILSMSQILATPFMKDSTARVGSNYKGPFGYYNEIPDGRHGCHEVQGFSLCAGEPLRIKNIESWSPVRMCAPKYVPADVCAVDRMLKATAHCELKAFTGGYYKCEGNKFGTAYIPEGCDKGKDENCEEIKSCSWVSVKAEEIKQLVDPIEYEGYCGF